MTTVIIDSKTKTIYTDSRGTRSEEIEINDDIEQSIVDYTVTEKCYDFKGGYITCTGAVSVLEFCVNQSRRFNEFTLPKAGKNCGSTTVVQVLKKGDCLELNVYKHKSIKKLFKKKYYWERENIILKTGVYIIGSGTRYAEGAYAVTKNPIAALKAAGLCDEYTDSNVVKYSFE